MILDALTRAEHERQLEKQPDLKFVSPVKPQKNNSNNFWLYVGLVLIANVLIILFVIRALSGDSGNEMAAAIPEFQQPLAKETEEILQHSSQVIADQPQETKPLVQETMQQASEVELPQIENAMLDEERPLAMELNTTQVPAVDRPLIYESKQPNAKPKTATPEPSVNLANAPAKSKGNVSFSSTELSSDDAMPITNKPKLLIDGVDNGDQLSNVINLRDLPENSRSSLNQYEVNVHVFDDDPIRRFVLINMDKYKEGDRIINNGPLVEKITPAGVVVDYGNGRALIPPK